MKNKNIGSCFLLLGMLLFAASTQAQSFSERQSVLKLSIQQFRSVLQQEELDYAHILESEAQMLDALQRRNESLKTSAIRAKILGFGPSGVRSLRLEIHVLWLRAQAQPYHLANGWRQLLSDFKLSPMPVMAAALQCLLAMAVYVYWLRRLLPVLRAWAKGKGLDRSKRLGALCQRVSWWYVRLHHPMEWWVLLGFITGVLAQLLVFVNFEPLQVIINWLLLGALGILLVDGFGAARHRRRQRKDAQATLRLRSLKWLGRIVIFSGLLLSLIAALSASGGTLAAWVCTFLMWAILPVLVVIVRWWRDPVMQKLSESEHQEKPLPRWILKRQKGFISLFCVVLGGIYLMLSSCLRWLLFLAAEQEIVRSAMAFLFRIEVARQSALEQQRNHLVPIDVEGIDAFKNNYSGSMLLQGIADEELQAVTRSCLQQRSTINVVYAGRGRGKTAFIARLATGLQENECTCLRVQCPAEGGFPELLEQLGQALSGLSGFAGISGARDVAAALKDSETIVIALDDIQRLVQPTIGGLKELERLVRFIRRTSMKISWVIGIEAASWRFVERARGERFLFDVEIELPRWKEESIAQLVEQRSADAGIEVSYDGMVLPRQMDMQDETEEASASRGYARILWEYAKGNPGVALYLWSQSLFKDEQGKTVVRLFEIPSLAGLESLSVTLLLVLRAILQLELAHKDEVAAATNLSSDEVVDALRLLMSRTYVERAEGNLYTISWPWYRAITTVLNRQHLLIL